MEPVASPNFVDLVMAFAVGWLVVLSYILPDERPREDSDPRYCESSD